MDVISSYQAEVYNVVASSGTALTEKQLDLIARYTKNIAVAYDQDSAGIKALERSIDLALGKGFNVSVVLLPSDADPDSLIQDSPEKWRQAIGARVGYVDYFFEKIKTTLDLETVVGKKEAAKIVLSVLNRLPDTKSLAEEFNVTTRTIQKDIYTRLYNFFPIEKNSEGKYPKGMYKIGRWPIHDDHQFKTNYIKLKDIVIFSSNIGTLLLAQRLSGQEFYDGLKKFGLEEKTGIDLPYEQIGDIHSLNQYKAGERKGKDNIFKATDSYGQGITITFMQLLKAYSAFNNNGKVSIPQIINNNLILPQKQIITQQTAKIMKKLLIQTVEEGTGRKARIDGIQIGGKTGTAQISNGKKGYQKKYISSFFGFANDHKNHKYTIGVTVLNPISTGKHWYYKYAASSAVPVFRELVATLIKLNYLEQKLDIIPSKIKN